MFLSQNINGVLSGKFAQNDNLGQTVYFNEPKEFLACVFNPSNDVSSVRVINHNLVMVTYKSEEDFIQRNGNLNTIIAAYVTAQARMKLYSYIRQLQDRVLYFDTGTLLVWGVFSYE